LGCGIPVLEKSLGLKLSGFGGRQNVGVGIALPGVCSRTGGVVLSIVGSLDGVRLAGMPLAPTCGKNMSAHLCVEKNNFGMGTPGSSEPDVRNARRSGQSAVVEDKAAVLAGIVLGLGGEKAFCVRRAVNFTMIKDGFAVAEDEVDVALDVAVGKVLPGGDAGLAIGSAVATAGVESVLIAEEANIAEDGLIGRDQNGQRLRADGDLLMSGIPVVGEGEVLGAEVVSAYLGSGRVECAAGRASTLIEDDDGLGSVWIAAPKFDVWLRN